MTFSAGLATLLYLWLFAPEAAIPDAKAALLEGGFGLMAVSAIGAVIKPFADLGKVLLDRWAARIERGAPAKPAAPVEPKQPGETADAT